MTGVGEIDGADGSSLTLTRNERGQTIRVRVSFTDDSGNRESLTSRQTVAVAPGPNSPATGAPTIGGMARVGETLTADTSGIVDTDGLDNADFSYQWMTGVGEIDGADGSSLTLTRNERGQTIRVRVSFTDDSGYGESLTSSSTTTVRPANQCPGTASGPTPTPVEVEAVPIVVESTTDKYYVLYVRHELDADNHGGDTGLGDSGPSRHDAADRAALGSPRRAIPVDEFPIADPGDADGDCIDDITEFRDPAGMNPLNPAPMIEPIDGAVAIPDRETFEALSYKGKRVVVDTHLRDLEYVKFYLFGMDTDRPVVYFMNTETHRAHTDFANVIGLWTKPLWLPGR